MANDIDYIAASFTRKAADVREIRNYAAQLLQELVSEIDCCLEVPYPNLLSLWSCSILKEAFTSRSSSQR